ncbi:nuclear transport factor 2 family protein [Spirillospora sp. NPDC047279]|uniref:nuclear transport factor 2 family protein n=1 Tax=Spirillospora sp. NPDC047279 TaxID=3155478 RepID=UPI0033F67768
MAESPETSVAAYLERLAAGDLDGVLALFRDDAVVESPLYGQMSARAFYTGLFEDTERSEITPVETFLSTSDPRRVAVRFRYDWTLADGTPTTFDCVDVMEFGAGPDGRIARLTIIYDTHPLRSVWAGVRS